MNNNDKKRQFTATKLEIMNVIYQTLNQIEDSNNKRTSNPLIYQ